MKRNEKITNKYFTFDIFLYIVKNQSIIENYFIFDFIHFCSSVFCHFLMLNLKPDLMLFRISACCVKTDWAIHLGAAVCVLDFMTLLPVCSGCTGRLRTVNICTC